MIEKGSKNTGVISNKKAAGGEASVLHQYQAEGRQTAYMTTFDREVSPQEVVGPVVIASSAVTYMSAAGATSGFALAKKQLGQTGWEQVSTGSLGAQAAAFTETKALDQSEYQSFVLAWRQANVVNEIRIAGNAATLDLNYALTLARVQQRTETRN
ncbi:MAG TPA: hypothetical protein VNF24_03515 [Candidatus Acidoferrales bacterium]|nr:hypothetical protein [Candidatus Acidoferrales bacterium]